MVIRLDGAQARRARRRSQGLVGSRLTPVEAVDRAVALQGQDLPAVLAAIAVRSAPGTSIADVRAAFDDGRLVRSWPVRGTLFATTPTRLRAMLALTGDRIHRATTLRRSQLGLDDGTIDRARGVVLDAVAYGGARRQEVMAALEAAGIATGGGRGYHLLMLLSVAGLVHWGPFVEGGAEQRLVATPPADPVDPATALVGVLRGLVAGRGPMTEADAAWWTKLPKTDLRRAAAGIEDLVEVEVDGARAWTIGEPPPDDAPSGVALVPGFDEWILGYADRSLVASEQMLAALVPGGNGVFRPAVLVDGVVVGTWRRPARGAPAVELVERTTAATRRAIDRAVADWPHGDG